MAAKIVAFLITLVLNIAFGVVALSFMIIAMNGYSESDAKWVLGGYLILALITAILTSGGALVLVHLLQKRQFSIVVAALTAIAVFSVIGIGLEIVCSLIGIGVAEFLRVNY